MKSDGYIQLTGLLASPMATLSGIYESKHCHTQD